MIPAPRLFRFLLALAFAALVPVRGDERAPLDLVPLLEQIASAPLDPNLKKALAGEIKDPDTLNQLLDALRAKPADAAGNLGGLGGLLSTLNVRFKAFQIKDTTDTSLGLEYSFERTVKSRELRTALADPLSLSFSVHAKGNVAFNSSVNPADFLDSGLSFDVFGSKGGFEPVIDGAAWSERLQQLLRDAGQFEGTPEELDRLPAWREFTTMLESQLSTQYFWRVSGHASLESNQDFSRKQYAYGLLATGVIRAWNPKSAWADFNLFDWPFAGLRYLTGADDRFQPSGRALPLLLVGLEQIDPAKNSDRLALEPDGAKYGRWRGELAMKTKIARVGGSDVWAFGSYRVFREISPSPAIRAAGLDRFEYWAVGLEMENGLGVTYSKGKLPLDRKSEQVFDIGYKLNFK